MTSTGTPTATRIVVGVDGSRESRLALRWAERIWRAFGGVIEAVIVWHFPTNFGSSYVPSDWNPEADARRCLQNCITDVLGTNEPPGLHLVVREGQPAEALLDESKDALILVLGSRGHGGFAGLLLGSVSANCAEHARCPVLVVHNSPTPRTA